MSDRIVMFSMGFCMLGIIVIIIGTILWDMVIFIIGILFLLPLIYIFYDVFRCMEKMKDETD